MKCGSGGGGIRTHDTFRYTGFQDQRDEPLCHPSEVGVITDRVNDKRQGPVSIAWCKEEQVQARGQGLVDCCQSLPSWTSLTR